MSMLGRFCEGICEGISEGVSEGILGEISKGIPC